MALVGTTIFEVRTTGDDTNNGGAFDPGQTAGMFTDGAATSATSASPVFSSASYNFVAGDVGAWVFIASGTNWTPGWYQIASVASNVATLSAAAGSGVIALYGTITTTTAQLGPSTATGCATVASPTAATWSIDYSQQAAAQFTYTDLASAGAGLTVSSAAKPFAKQHVGNALVITGGTNFTAGRYVIASVAASVATVVGAGNITTGVGASGTGGLGGALATPGQAGAHMLASMACYIKTGSFTQTSASTNVAGGNFTPAAAVLLEGYDTVRGDLNPIGATGTRPTITASAISTFTMIGSASLTGRISNLILDGASLTSSRGVNAANACVVTYVTAKNCTNGGITGSGYAVRCSTTGCSSVAALSITNAIGCVSYSNTISGITSTVAVACLAYSNSGASSDGFATTTAVNCSSYGNGRDGFRSGVQGGTLLNCISEGNTGVGFTLNGNPGQALIKCAAYNNTGGATSVSSRDVVTGLLTLSASPFTSAAGGDFSLNNTANAGAACRAAGFPGAFPGVSTTGYSDIGAAQHADSPAVFAMQIFGG